jgi:two-component system, NtrC family, sensor kinase
MRSFRPSLTVAILAFLSCLLLLTWLLFSLFAFRTSANDLYDQKSSHARMLLATFVSQLPEVIPSYPDGLIQPSSPAAFYGQKLAEDPDFIRMTLLDGNGKYIYTAGRDGSDVYAPFMNMPAGGEGRFVLADGSGIGYVVRVVRNDAVVGRAGLVVSLASEKARLKRSRDMFMAYFAIDFILLLGLGSFILSRIVVRPVNQLLSATEKITRGNYGHQVTVSGSSEMSVLAESFNAMSETLQLKDMQVNTQLSALEKANEELRQAREETLRSEKMASIGLLAAGMAHEIGTPLASIMGYAELLTGNRPDSDPESEYAKRITQDCNRIDRIVRGLLDYSRPRAANIEPVDIGKLVLDSIQLLEQQGAFRNIELTPVFTQPLLPARVDPFQLQQVLINLMLNSRDAMPDGGKLSISVSMADSSTLPDGAARCMRIDVLDSGTGILPENIGRLFDPFYTTKPPGKGTGLGLAIVSRIVEGLGGKIAVKSKPGVGTCFTLWLPVVNQEGTAS